MNDVFRIKPLTIEELKCFVKNFSANMDPRFIRRACEMIRDEQEGHFQHLLQSFYSDTYYSVFVSKLCEK